MVASNVFVTVTDPEPLYEGTSPYALFEARFILVYRYATEALARSDSSGSLLDAGSGVTFTLIAPTDPVTEEAGPYRYGYYDSGQAMSSWYRYRFADEFVATLSPLSDPWEADNRPAVTVRDILYEVGNLLGQSIERGTVTAGAATSVTVPSLFKSTVLDAAWYDGHWIVVSYDAAGAGAAPEGQERRISAMVTSTGVASVERDWDTANPAAGDQVLVSALLQPSVLVRLIDRIRERMKVVVTTDIALALGESRYPAPAGVKSDADVYAGFGVLSYANSNREDEFAMNFRVEFDGIRGWIYVPEYPGTSSVIRLRHLKSFRDLEGPLTLMSDTTQAPIEWLRPAVAYAAWEHLRRMDPRVPEFQDLTGISEEEVQMASHSYAPQIQRSVSTNRQLVGPADPW